MSIKKWLFATLVFVLVFSMLTACAQPAAPQPDATDKTAGKTEETTPKEGEAQPPAASEEKVALTFMYWGSPQEREAVDAMVAQFEASHPNIDITTQHVPDAYDEKIATMLASGTEPDVAYLNEAQALQWASEGKLLDLTNYFKSDPEAANRLPATYYNYGSGKTIGTNTAGEIGLLFYNKEIFDRAGAAYPPAEGNKAMAWSDFVELAKQVTFDVNGNNAASPNFDPENIETFGISFPRWWLGYMPFIYSNGGKFASDDGMKLLLNEPKAVEVLQNLQDLIYVHHVAPTPAQSEALPATEVMMQTGKVAMTIEGHWKILDYSQMGMQWGIGVLPKYDQPMTMLLGAPSVIFSSTEHPEEAFEFYKYHNSPQVVDLFKKGLWMPLQQEYYTDDAKIKEWIEGLPNVYPPESRTAVVDYTVNFTPIQPPVYWLKNYFQISSEAVEPALELLWTGEATAQEAADQAVRDAEPLMQGKWTD
jgi:multiple sugar transport system substrate-binding protein